jgi:hypothetical protein
MSVFNKVFFHGAGPGVGDLMRGLDNAGIPFTIKSAANGGYAAEGALYARNSGVAHQIIYRDPNPLGADNDEPAYELSPVEAAGEHWARLKQAIPPEVGMNRDLIWIEPVNEIDTHTYVAWLGEFCYEYALIANDDGYKVLLAGFNAGQPEPEDWELYFYAFLELCSERPDRVGVSLHEGKLGDFELPPEDYSPWLVGRYKFLNEACDTMGFNRPTIFISEWAWAYNDMPDVEMAMSDVAWLAEDIAQFPNVKGICLWNLDRDPKWAGLPGKLTNLIHPILEYTLAVRFPDPEPPPPPPPPDEWPSTLEGVLWSDSLETQCISLNPEAAFVKTIFADGFTPVGSEVRIVYDGTAYAYMAAETLTGRFPRRVYYARVPHWNNILYTEEPPDDEIPDYGDSVDMADYFLPANGNEFGPIITLQNNWGASNERMQLQRAEGITSYVTKGSQWERRVIGSEYIDLNMDTSPGGGEYYTSDGHWLPRIWGVGWQDFTSHGNINFYRKSDCKPVPGKSYSMTSKMEFSAHFEEMSTGVIVFSDVIELSWIVDGEVDETYWYARGVGLIRWLKFDGRESRAVEFIPVGTQENNVREIIPCAEA